MFKRIGFERRLVLKQDIPDSHAKQPDRVILTAFGFAAPKLLNCGARLPSSVRAGHSWSTTLRVEKRLGSARYFVLFSNARRRASLCVDPAPLSTNPVTLEGAPYRAAAEWLKHTRPRARPIQPIRRTFPRNRSRRRHGQGGAL